jgi:putative Mg2+ transporter-C (MgtC) family protein
VRSDLSILLDMLLALVLAAAIGWERESAGKPAGLRTHAFVGMGAALFVSLGDPLIQQFQHYGGQVQFDPLRLVEAVVAAMGFLGAGTIFVARNGERVQGLTTAASLWVTAAIGVAVALERHLLAVGATVLVLIVLHALLPLSTRIAPRPGDGAAERRGQD